MQARPKTLFFAIWPTSSFVCRHTVDRNNQELRLPKTLAWQNSTYLPVCVAGSILRCVSPFPLPCFILLSFSCSNCQQARETKNNFENNIYCLTMMIEDGSQHCCCEDCDCYGRHLLQLGPSTCAFPTFRFVQSKHFIVLMSRTSYCYGWYVYAGDL